jgi:hypothetical protein
MLRCQRMYLPLGCVHDENASNEMRLILLGYATNMLTAKQL